MSRGGDGRLGRLDGGLDGRLDLGVRVQLRFGLALETLELGLLLGGQAGRGGAVLEEGAREARGHAGGFGLDGLAEQREDCGCEESSGHFGRFGCVCLLFGFGDLLLYGFVATLNRREAQGCGLTGFSERLAGVQGCVCHRWHVWRKLEFGCVDRERLNFVSRCNVERDV